MSLELSAMRWLWLEKKCELVVEERSPRYGIGQPDVLGITKGRHLIEIEIKRSASDFCADFKKPHRLNREMLPDRHPRQFYYLMPKKMAEKLKDKIPAWAGLMQSDWYPVVEVIKQAPVNESSQRLTVKECSKLLRVVTNYAMSLRCGNLQLNTNYRERDTQSFIYWTDAKTGTYEI